MRIVALTLALAGCCFGASGRDCDTIVSKMRACDPTSAGASDAVLALQCPGWSLRTPLGYERGVAVQHA